MPAASWWRQEMWMEEVVFEDQKGVESELDDEEGNDIVLCEGSNHYFALHTDDQGSYGHRCGTDHPRAVR